MPRAHLALGKAQQVQVFAITGEQQVADGGGQIAVIDRHVFHHSKKIPILWERASPAILSPPLLVSYFLPTLELR